MKKIMLVLLMAALPSFAQEKQWAVNASTILPGALAARCQVQANPKNSAWITLQKDDEAKLVRVNGDGKVYTFTLPDPTATAPYTIRISSDTKCVVQSGRIFTVITWTKVTDPVTGKTGMGYRQRDLLFPDDDAETGLSIAYDAEAQRTGDNLWYITTTAGMVTQVVMRKVP